MPTCLLKDTQQLIKILRMTKCLMMCRPGVSSRMKQWKSRPASGSLATLWWNKKIVIIDILDASFKF